MTKSDLIEAVAGHGDGWTRREAESAVNAIFGAMSEALVAGDRIEIRGLGSFRVKDRQPRVGRNPRTGETVAIPARRVPTFTAGKVLRGLVEST